MTALNELLEKIRTSAPDSAIVPGFDPLNGNESAKFLLLLEAPGPRAATPTGGYVSFDNQDPTARNLKSQLELGKAQSFRKASIAAGVLRRMVVDHGEQLFPLVF